MLLSLSTTRRRKRNLNCHYYYYLFSVAAIIIGGLIIIVLPSSATCVSARVLESSEIAVGDWDVTLRCRDDVYDSVLFPPSTAADTAATLRSKDGNCNDGDDDDQIARRRRFWKKWLPSFPRRHECHLSVYANGRFELRPSSPPPPSNAAAAAAEVKANTKEGQLSSSSPRRLVARGKWNVRSNPYCVTDRFFDEITLRSHVRTQKKRTKKRKETTSAADDDDEDGEDGLDNEEEEEEILQKGRLSVHGRLVGRYAEGGGLWSRLQQGWRRKNNNKEFTSTTVRGRLSHGVILWEEENTARSSKGSSGSNKPFWTRLQRQQHRVVSSFTARRKRVPSTENSALEKEEFGY